MTTKPREFWIVPDNQGFGKIRNEPYRTLGQIHVIEAAPVLAKIARLEAERDRYKAALQEIIDRKGMGVIRNAERIAQEALNPTPITIDDVKR